MKYPKMFIIIFIVFSFGHISLIFPDENNSEEKRSYKVTSDDVDNILWVYTEDSSNNSIYTALSYSPDGKTIVSGNRNGSIKLWDASTGKLITTLFGSTNSVTSVIFSPDGKIIASSSYDKTISIWDVSKGKLVNTFSGHTDSVYTVAFTPDGKTLASGSGDKSIILWEIPTGKLVNTFSGHTDSVYTVAFSPDGKTLASGSGDKTIKLWTIPTGNPLLSIKDNACINSISFSLDGKRIASASDKIKFWDTISGVLISINDTKKYTSYDDITVSAISINLDGSKIASIEHKSIMGYNQIGKSSNIVSIYNSISVLDINRFHCVFSSLFDMLPDYSYSYQDTIYQHKNQLLIRNPNNFKVYVGIRSNDTGDNFIIPENDFWVDFYPDGDYELYFVFSDDPKALFKGDNFKFKSNNIFITLDPSPTGNYRMNKVK